MTFPYDSPFCQAFAAADPQSHREFLDAYRLYGSYNPQRDLLLVLWQRISHCFSPETRALYPAVVADAIDTMRLSLLRSVAREHHLELVFHKKNNLHQHAFANSS